LKRRDVLTYYQLYYDFYSEKRIDGCVVTDIYLQLGKRVSTPDSVKPVFQLSTSTATQDGPAATTPSKAIALAAST
jgi:hypothetical protein